MKILHLLKRDLRDERDKWAHAYRQMRKEDRAKAQMLFHRLQAAKAHTEACLQANLFERVKVR